MITSESLDKLAPALVQAQADLENPTKNKKNKFFDTNYVTLEGVIEHIRPILAENDLAITMPLYSDGELSIGFQAMLVHKSGQYIQFAPVTFNVQELKKGNLYQSAGMVISYMRRYCLESVFNIAESDSDPDGGPGPKPQNKQNKVNNSQSRANSGVKQDRINWITQIYNSNPAIAGPIIDNFLDLNNYKKDLESLKKLQPNQLKALRNKLENKMKNKGGGS